MVLEVSMEPLHIKTSEIIDSHGDEAPWYERLFSDGRNVAGLICDRPGGSNDDHYHPDFNEFWVILKGELEFEIGDYPAFHARKGDVVMSPRGLRHLIKTVSSEPSVRLHISKIGSDHSHKKPRSSNIVPFPDQKLPPNLVHSELRNIMAHFGEPPWSTSLVDDDLNKANLICHGPGMSNNAHWHPDFDEWWTILKGELTWNLGSKRPLYTVEEGDIMFVPRGLRHHISTIGSETSLRLAITNVENLHVYTDQDGSAPPPRE
jgi:quercetin dioxygenase-like cupin family protein